ncbi:hypothetical protein [Agrobacterium tumefaciens]|uniref:portal protein n=1 Tax=Agrobacterium tumefaciens TaxID=358 RepID=UPI0015747C27|nr:hypothetical protein [Agrobacterium tumefaciens]
MYDTEPAGADLGNARVSTGDAWSRASGADQPKGKQQHELDNEKNTLLHRKSLAMYQQELDRQAENRQDQAVDEDFYDNIQWTEADARELRERGQDPLVFNVIAASVNWVIGTEKRGRTDFKVLPRRKEDGKPAQRKSELLKYLSDVNRSPFHKSRAFEDATKVGIGWIECGVQDGDDGEPIYDRYESWRNLLWDSACTEKDLSDCRYIFRTKWVDLDIATAMFPGRAGLLKTTSQEIDRFGLDSDGDDAMDSAELARENYGSTRTAFHDYQRQRVRLIECWIRLPVKVKRMQGGQFRGEVYDEYSPGHAEALESGASTLAEKTMMRMHVCIFTTAGMLYVGESPYRHNSFPFTPVWCYRRGRDGMPYGMIRGMRDIQYDINKRAAKALHILSTNKVIMDEGAVDDLDEFAEEVARPDAIIVKKSGKELTLNAERELAPAHMELMSRSIAMIQQQSGVTDEAMGRTTNATSGIAIQARQNQGSMSTAGIFDNLRFAYQVHGEKQLSLIEQFFTEEKQFRITNMRGQPTYLTVNDGMPENDIVRTKADFIISENDWRATIRQSQVEELMAVLGQLAPVAPQLALVMIDLIVEEMDIGNREELVKRIRSVTGMSDPDQEEPTEEEVARAQQQQVEAQKAEAMFAAELAGKQADAQKKQADAVKAQAGAQQIMSVMAGQNVDTQRKALETALAMLGAPSIVPVADTVLHEAGFQGRTEQETIAQQQAMEQAQQQQAVEQQQAAEQQAMQEQQMAEKQAQEAQQLQPGQDGPIA